MSRFYADIEGSRGEATRQGTAKSGIRGHIRGWDVGARVECFVNRKGEDVVRVYATRGSSHSLNEELLAEFTKESFDLCRYCTELESFGDEGSMKCKHGLRPFYCQRYHDCRVSDCPRCKFWDLGYKDEPANCRLGLKPEECQRFADRWS